MQQSFPCKNRAGKLFRNRHEVAHKPCCCVTKATPNSAYSIRMSDRRHPKRTPYNSRHVHHLASQSFYQATIGREWQVKHREQTERRDQAKKMPCTNQKVFPRTNPDFIDRYIRAALPKTSHSDN